MERFELRVPGRIAREVALAKALLGDQICYAQLGETGVLDYHAENVRGAQPTERLPRAVRLAALRLLEEPGLDGAAEEGLYVALWRSGAKARLSSHGTRPFTPPVLRSHAVMMVLHPKGMEVVLNPGTDGEECLSLAVSNAVLAPDSSSYHLANRVSYPPLLVVVGTREDAGTRERGPEQHAVALEGKHGQRDIGRRGAGGCRGCC